MRDHVRRLRDQLRAQPLWFRLLLRLALWSLFALGPATRLTAWLCIGAIVEAWPWQLWAGSYLDFAQNMLEPGRPVVYVCLLVVGWWLLGLLIDPKPPERGRGLRLLLAPPKLAWLAVVAVCLLALSPLLAIGGVRAARTLPPRTDHLLQENCGHCHSPYRPQHLIKPAGMWRATVRRMIERNEAPVSDEDGERIIDWLTDYRSYSDSWMFRARCERCHGRQHLREVPRTAEEWSWIVRRVSWVSPFAFRADQQEQVDRYVRAELASPEPEPGSAEAEEQERRLLLQRSCNPCHSISLILEEGALDDAETMIRRMARKNPDLVPEDRVHDLVEAVLAVPTDEQAFRRWFPHDILRETER